MGLGPTWVAPMPEPPTKERQWRLDRLGASPDAVEDRRPQDGEALVVKPEVAGARPTRITGWIHQSYRALRHWLAVRVGIVRRDRLAFEEIIHRFALLIDQSDDPAAVEAELMRLVRQMAPSCRIEIVPEAERDADDEAAILTASAESVAALDCGQRILEIPLRCGASICGRLRIRPRAGGLSSFSHIDIRRLTTLSTMAACAMEGLGLFTEWPLENASHDPATTPPSSERVSSPSGERPISALPHLAIQLQDATFLNAVLPFALSQARRHREPLSIVCIAIDRLSAIKQLLGKPESDRLVREVAQLIGSLIRSSDIVTRLDDDRVVVVLPRAPSARYARRRQHLPRPSTQITSSVVQRPP